MTMPHYSIYDLENRRILPSDEVENRGLFISVNGGVNFCPGYQTPIGWTPQYIALRSTGLMDMNGEVIHEGDILEYYLNGELFYVEWERGAFRLYGYPVDEGEDFQSDNIGNMVTERCFTIVGHHILSS